MVISRCIGLDLSLAFRCLLKRRSHAAQYLFLRHANKLGLSSMSSLRTLKFTLSKSHAARFEGPERFTNLATAPRLRRATFLVQVSQDLCLPPMSACFRF
jgi:hypothetical protein